MMNKKVQEKENENKKLSKKVFELKVAYERMEKQKKQIEDTKAATRKISPTSSGRFS